MVYRLLISQCRFSKIKPLNVRPNQTFGDRQQGRRNDAKARGQNARANANATRRFGGDGL